MRGKIWLLMVLAAGAIASCVAPPGTAMDGLPVASPPVASPTDVTRAFYTAYRSLGPNGGIPNAQARAKLEPTISPALKQLLIDAGAAEARYAKATKNEVPPLMEGDPFTSSFEGANAVAEPDCNWTAQRGACSVALTYGDKQEKPVNWTDRVDLVLTDKGWRVDDIEYGAAWAFGNRGKLTDLLKSVIEESKKPFD